jgi:hypothetical protein
MNDHIVISASTIATLSNELKAELAAKLGLAVAAPVAPPPAEDDFGETVELGIQSARAFLQGCSDRTAEILDLIVAEGESFSLRELERKAGVPEGGLRGVWTGVTKRTRTITGDPEAYLVDWDGPDDKGDWRGRLTKVTLDSFKRALAKG